MRIAVITSSYPRYTGDGAAPFVQSLSIALQKRGHTIEILAPYDVDVREDEAQSIKVERFKYIYPLRWHILGHARSLDGDTRLRPLSVVLLPLFLISGLHQLLKLTRSQHTDLIHAHWLLPNGLVAMWAASIRKIPFMISLHGSDMYMAGKKKAFGWVARRILKRAGAVSACSQELKERAEALGAEGKVHLIAWGADPNKFKLLQDKIEMRKCLGLAADQLVICSLGRMVAKKGFSVLVDAFARLVASEGNAKLCLVIGGDGPERQKLKAKADDLGIAAYVDLPGRINWQQVPEFLGAADMFVLPSVRDAHGNLDGLPTVLLEAMSCGLPCVASDVGGVNLVIRNGENGWLVRPGSSEDIFKRLTSLVTDEKSRTTLGNQARFDVETKFNWDRVALTFEKLATAVLVQKNKFRLGTMYRNAILPELIPLPAADCVLDIGCRDDSWLKKLDAGLRVGVDLHPQPSSDDVLMVSADATHLPFRRDAFDLVTALDMIEHVEVVPPIIDEISRVLQAKGDLIITTPAQDIKLFPSFLTGWVSKSWGHYWRPGFTKKEVGKMLQNDFNYAVMPWQAKTYLRSYLFLKTLSFINAKWAIKSLKKVIKHDIKHPMGRQGYWLVTGKRKGSG